MEQRESVLEVLTKYTDEASKALFNSEIQAISPEDERYFIGVLTNPDTYLLSDEFNDFMQSGDWVTLYANGAVVKADEDKVKCHIEWVDPDKKGIIKTFHITLKKDSSGANRKMGHIFNSVPWGVIKKNITGIGATTLELRSFANSIIVVPTKNLAYEKYKTGWDESLQKYKYLYVGSEIGDFKHSTSMGQIQDYLKDNDIVWKKIICVSDSLDRLMIEAEIPYDKEKKHYSSNWRLMVDEIDMYQSDGAFRPNLGKVIDYYFLFDPHSRSLVSATMRPFSDPRINNEPVIELHYEEESEGRVINKLIHSNNPRAIVKDMIEKHFKDTPNDKIVVAYNHVLGMTKIIEALPSELKSECAILCGENSISEAGDYYSKLSPQAILPKRINFITSAYFVGVDFNERFHLISISESEKLYTLLTPERLKQIAGRCRDKDGVLSETIVYNTKEPKDKATDLSYSSNIKDSLEKFAERLANACNALKELAEKHPKQIGNDFVKAVDELVEKSKKSFFGSTPVSLIRNDINGKTQVAYLNIDAILDYFRLKRDLYVKPEQLQQWLEADNTIQSFEVIDKVVSDSQERIEKAAIQTRQELEYKQLLKLIEELKGLDATKRLNDEVLKKLHRSASNKGKTFIKRLTPLYPYISIEVLTGKLSELAKANAQEQQYRRLHNSLIFWALSSKHPFKEKMLEKFVVGQQYNPAQRLQYINEIMSLFCNHPITNEIVATKTLNDFFDTERVRSTAYKDYKILSANPLNLVGTPKTVILASESVKGLIKFSTE